ncbi:MAG: hypothetical protein Q9166_003871 [cf. Caloplaca sp. 2 TL-2023]
MATQNEAPGYDEDAMGLFMETPSWEITQMARRDTTQMGNRNEAPGYNDDALGLFRKPRRPKGSRHFTTRGNSKGNTARPTVAGEEMHSLIAAAISLTNRKKHAVRNRKRKILKGHPLRLALISMESTDSQKQSTNDHKQDSTDQERKTYSQDHETSHQEQDINDGDENTRNHEQAVSDIVMDSDDHQGHWPNTVARPGDRYITRSRSRTNRSPLYIADSEDGVQDDSNDQASPFYSNNDKSDSSDRFDEASAHSDDYDFSEKNGDVVNKAEADSAGTTVVKKASSYEIDSYVPTQKLGSGQKSLAGSKKRQRTPSSPVPRARARHRRSSEEGRQKNLEKKQQQVKNSKRIDRSSGQIHNSIEKTIKNPA